MCVCNLTIWECPDWYGITVEIKCYIKLVNMHKNFSQLYDYVNYLVCVYLCAYACVCVFECVRVWFNAGQCLVNIMIFEQMIYHVVVLS